MNERAGTRYRFACLGALRPGGVLILETRTRSPPSGAACNFWLDPPRSAPSSPRA